MASYDGAGQDDTTRNMCAISSILYTLYAILTILISSCVVESGFANSKFLQIAKG